MSTKPLNLGVIGAGRIGRLFIDNIATRLPSARLEAIADVNLAAAKELAGRHGVRRVASDFLEVLEDKAIDAVLVCSSTETHLPIIRAAAERGKHVYCEKPIGLDVTAIRETLEVVARSSVKLQIGFNRRFDPSFARVREAVAQGRIGQPHIVRVTSRDPAPPSLAYVRTSGGLLMDMTIHDFDMVRFLSGSEATEIMAWGAALVDPEIGRAGDIDTCVVTMKLENGALATIDNSRKAVYGYDQRVEVHGAAGMVAAANHPVDTHQVSDAKGVHRTGWQDFFMERYREAYLAEVEAFVRCVQGDTEPPVTGHDGLMAVVMSKAANESLREGHPVRCAE